MPVCLLVTSDPDRAAEWQRDLRPHGLRLHAVLDPGALQPMLGQWRFDAVLCDAPAGVDVAETVRSLRRDQPAPVVVLASESEDDAVAALEAGASAVIAVGSSPRLIAVKVQRLIDLAAGPPEDASQVVTIGRLRLDPRRADAVFADRPVRLTRGEFDLLLLLAAQSGGVVDRDVIMRTIGRTASGDPGRCADMHVCRIRRKLHDAGASSVTVETVRGRGYALRAPAEAARAEAAHRTASRIGVSAPW